MSGKVDYFVAQQAAPIESACTLVSLDARFTPALIQGLGRYLHSSAWLSAEDWYRGYQSTAQAMEALLMDCGEKIINNIIAFRGIDPTAPRDETTGVPLTSPPGSTLLDVFTTLQTSTGTPGAALEAIVANTAAGADATRRGLGVTDNPDDVVLLVELLSVI